MRGIALPIKHPVAYRRPTEIPDQLEIDAFFFRKTQFPGQNGKASVNQGQKADTERVQRHKSPPISWSAVISASATSTILRLLCMARSEEHTSELQSLMRISYAVFCLKTTQLTHHTTLSLTVHL